ncbi:PAS domain-containing protein [Deinococcus sp. HMF7604]|uniref:PAS domain-containing sensor histidine kinase n=1 Tax=Deinococcus betulae TaxID=2873312 RepID=UPI001CCB9C48|nr:ATP-binding protein [Deinococcus betulae]MBZ9751127.1 PAS domain-containing protein [Deinococcus betulae]
MTSAAEVRLTPGQLQTIIDASGDCIKVLGLDARLLTMNLGGQQVMEIDDFQQCQDVLWTSFWEGEAQAQVEAALDAARAGQTTTLEAPARTFAGTPKWWRLSVSPLRDDHGHITHLLAMSSDITARKTAEEDRQASQAALHHHASTLEQQVRQQTQALGAFVTFTTAVASSTDLKVLGAAATQILQDTVEGAISGFYLVQGDTALPLTFSANTPPEVVAARQAGVPLRTPLAAEAFRTGQTTFATGAQGRAQSVGHSTALSITPYLAQGQPFAFLATGSTRPLWTEQEQATIASVGQGLGLALERVRQAQVLEERAVALDAFVSFTEAVGVETDLHCLARQAVAVVQAHLSDVSVAYYELKETAWKGVVWSADVSPEVVKQMQAGVPLDAPDFAEAVRTGGPVFVQGWAAEDNSLSAAKVYGAAGFVPLLIGGEVRAIFAVGKRAAKLWPAQDQAIVRAVVRGLSLAVERAVQAQQLTQQRDALNRRTQDLEEANAELESFTYSASHDLRTPVRHVMAFADLAQRGLDKGQLDKVPRHLQVVKEGAARMSTLIDGMLVLSRSGRQSLRREAVELSALVKQAQQDAAAEYPAQAPRWHLGPLPVVQGDPGLLQQVMTNLVSNAVKYASSRPVAEVRIWAEEHPDAVQVWVQDNGVGFDPRYADKLFGLFQRLHAHEAFPGTGIGLATVRRIVTRHGGQVMAQSSGTDGATFGFTLPRHR